MKQVRRGIFLIAAVAIFAMPLYAFSQSVTVTSTKFNDVSAEHPFIKGITYLKGKGLVKGYGDGTFQPDSSVSRAEFITMVMASVNTNPQGSNCFKDVKDEWFAKFVCQAKTQKLISGYNDGTFKPNNNINFAEASVILAKANKLSLEALKAGEPWYKPATVKFAAQKGIPVTIDYMDKKISRGETAEMIYRIKAKIKTKPTKTFEALTAPLPKISSCGELKEKVAAFQYTQNYGRDIMYKMALPMMSPTTTGASQDTAAEETAAPSESENAAEGGEGKSDDYSSTNVQVEGVDEADVIKNDGEFIYVISKNSVRIVKAFPPEQMAQVAKLVLSDKSFTPSDMYVAGNKLVVLGSTYDGTERAYGYGYYGGSKTELFVVDMTDKANLKEERSVKFDGNEISSRRIGKYVYVVVNNSPVYSTLEKGDTGIGVVPTYLDSLNDTAKPVCGCADIRFMPRYEEPNMLYVAGINIEDSTEAISNQTIMGSGDTVYSSVDNMYIATTQYDTPAVDKFESFAPFYRGNSSTEKTVVFQFALNAGKVEYKAQGSVKGHLLNQFAMDENGETFRLATTIGEVWDSVKPSTNNIFVLNKNDLKVTLGSVQDIAPGEKIYSVRFIGNRAYMVTFKKVDPFFVIDLTDSANPKILGALKIPGYSDYLHPYDENHIIGFGKDAVDPANVEEEWPGRDFDFAWYQGIKIALFDVTDPTNPKMMFKEMIGDRGTESEVLNNHKALLFDKKRNLFALPVTVAEIKDKTSKDQYTGDTYGTTVFQGAYVYTLDLVNGFQLKGKITHYEDPSVFAKQGYYWYGDNNEIKRIVSIGDYLYTISLGKIKAVLRDTMVEKKALPLEVDEEPVEPIYVE
ncbi:MAG: beta-propeller domain-containing protein [Candidatus Gracilibacteria bacterium]